MNNIQILFRREMRSYFNSPVAYIVITLFLVITGYFFSSSLFLANSADLRTLFGIAPVIFMFFAPAITMRLLAEERRAGTMEILVTLPVKDSEIVLGKFLAGLALLVISILLTLIHYITITNLGNADFGASFGGYLGLILMGAVYISIGLFTSSLSPNQIIAFIVGFVIIFALFMIDKVLIFLPISLASTLEYLSVDYHFRNIARGVIDSRDLIYYGSMIFFFLFLAVKMTESRKWR
ncbi:MAG: ABC transporter permease [candidate division Zixibacteria bacterium]|nr:ABC transporter permease [candidate division Zixibacteria bacterium]